MISSGFAWTSFPRTWHLMYGLPFFSVINACTALIPSIEENERALTFRQDFAYGRVRRTVFCSFHLNAYGLGLACSSLPVKAAEACARGLTKQNRSCIPNWLGMSIVPIRTGFMRGLEGGFLGVVGCSLGVRACTVCEQLPGALDSSRGVNPRRNLSMIFAVLSDSFSDYENRANELSARNPAETGAR